MNFLMYPQCSFCANMNQYVNINESNQQLYQVKPYSYYGGRPLLYCYDMTQRPMDDKYTTYYNVSKHFPVDNEPQYVQVIESEPTFGRLQYGISSNNVSYDMRHVTKKPNGNNHSVVICTCNDFINSANQNKIIYETFPSRHAEQACNNQMTVLSQFIPNQDSIDSHNKSIDDQPENSIYSNGSLLNDPMCRFCHLTNNSQSDQLISPCYCCGTLKYVHQSCLKTWLEVSKKQRKNNGNKSPQCELCGFKYVRKRKFQFGKIRQPKLSQNDCALHLIFLCSLLVMVTSASVTILCFAMEKSVSNVNRAQYDKSSDNNVKQTDQKMADMSKNGNILCEYLSNLNLKDYNNHQSASKLSVICDLMLNKKRRPNKLSDSMEFTSDHTVIPLPKQFTTSVVTEHSKDHFQRANNKPTSANVGNRLWILSPEDAVTLASGVIFFIAFFIAMMVQVKSNYTCYQLMMQWIRLNYTYEVQTITLQKKVSELELKMVTDESVGKLTEIAVPREYIERCVTEI